MKLFKKKIFVWTEPWFFCQRVRDKSDWFRAIRLALLAFIGTSTLLFFAQGANLSWWQIVIGGLAAGAVVQLGVEAAYLRRDISFDEDSIEAFGNAGQFTSYSKFALSEITSANLRRSEEIGLPFSMLVLRTLTGGSIMGIPKSIRLERLAHELHHLQVPVTLSGWEPAADADSQPNEYLYSAPEDTSLQNAKVESIPEMDQNLMKAPDMIVALLMSAWLLLVWLGLVIWAGIYLYQNWQNFSIWIIACCAIAMFVSLTIPLGYISIFGDYLSANYLVRNGKSRAKNRGGSLIKSFDDKLFPVELIQRETWAARAPKVVDFGFLQVDPDRRQILFEGNKERWIVPFASVKLCRVEEVQYGTGGDSATGELRCYVDLVFQKDSGPFEIGMRNADKEIGKNNDTRRQRKAVELFEYLVGGF